MERVHGAEAQLGDVEAFQDVQHLRDVHARGGRRRRTQYLPAAITAADRCSFRHLVAGEVGATHEAAGFLHALDQQVAERAAMQGLLTLLGDERERVRIVACHQLRAGLQRHAAGKEAGGGEPVPREVDSRVLDAVRQIGRDGKAPGRMADRGLHHVGQRHRAVAFQGETPGAQRARRRHRLRSHQILGALDVVDFRRGPGDRLVNVGMARLRHGTHAVQDAVAAVREADMAGRAADQPHHHRLDHGQRELHGDGCIDRIAARRQHLRPRRRGQRMVGHGHAALAARRLLLANERCARALAPICRHRYSPRYRTSASSIISLSHARGRGRAE